MLLITKLWSSKLRELDVCGRPLFANPVRYIRDEEKHVGDSSLVNALSSINTQMLHTAQLTVLQVTLS